MLCKASAFDSVPVNIGDGTDDVPAASLLVSGSTARLRTDALIQSIATRLCP